MTATYRAVGPDIFGINTFTQQRVFLPFDLSSYGLDAGRVESATLILRCASIVGGGCIVRLSSATGASGFGATLDATNADWNSTNTYTEDELAVTSTGTKQWSIDPTHLDYGGVTYLRLKNIDEGTSGPTWQTSATFNTTNDGTPEWRPLLRLTLRTGQLIFVQTM